MAPIINSREDLDALKGTPLYREAMERLKASMTTMVDEAVRGENEAEEVEPVWVAHETLASIERLDFSKQQFLAAFDAMGLA